MSAEESFNVWLTKTLQSLDIDEDVFGNYIIGILTSEETISEKRENLQDLLTGITACEVLGLCDEIFEKWGKAQQESILEKEKIVIDEKNSVSVKLAFIMEKQAQSVMKVNSSSESEKKLKDAILAQYSQVSDDDDLDDPFEECGSLTVTTTSGSIPHNGNVDAVVNAEKEQREKSKAEYEKKKSQDKLNKDKQKQKQQERREKERKRTQKGEHRR